jgi:dTDP-4-dehydrorhamnose 3,5-epimerase
MNVLTTPLPGLLRLVPRQFADERGRFIVTFDQAVFDRAVGAPTHFVQDNESTSRKGVLRGLHFQLPPSAQGKLVHVVRGSVLDVCVDLRPDSPTRGGHYKQVLDPVQKELLWIPPGFAHGFVALEDDTVFAYKCTALYDPANERCIRWNDPDLAIDWGVANPLVSTKDAAGARFNERAWWPAA